MTTLTYTVFSLGEAQLHQLHTSNGKVRAPPLAPPMACKSLETRSTHLYV